MSHASRRRPVVARLLAALGLVVLLLDLLATPVLAGEVFANPPLAGGIVNASAWVTPDGSDSDMYAWDEFILEQTQTITEVRWRGGYKYNGQYGKAVDFRLSFFESIGGGFQPVITALPEHESQETVIATFHTDGPAGETFAGSSAGVTQYDYHFVLPEPVTLQGGVTYWFRVVAAQPSPYPDWGMASSAPGSHFVYNQGAHMFQNWPNELAFSLHAQWEGLGQGLAGSAGVPQLVGQGSLAAGTNSSLELTSARASAPTWMVAGLSALDAPFKGGTLVPDPQLLVNLTTDGSGAASLPFVMSPGVPAGVQLFVQAWVVDPAAVAGFAASDGLVVSTP